MIVIIIAAWLCACSVVSTCGCCAIDLAAALFSSSSGRYILVPKPGRMASSVGLALPEPLQDKDAKSWFKRYEVCAAANEWNAEKQLLRLPTLLRGRAWAIFDALPDGDKGSYNDLKKALLERLSPDTDEDRLSARDELARRRLRDGESVDELARDMEKLLDKASPDLPPEARETELRFHLTTALPEKISFQLKLLPKLTYDQTIAKARELRLIFQRASEQVSQVDTRNPSLSDQRLEKLEEAVSQVSAQLAAISSRCPDAAVSSRCFKCGKPGHLARNCRSASVRDIVCFRCGGRGHIARQCQTQGNDKGGVPTRRAGGVPYHN